MKNILAENLLRFGAKNLNSKSIQTLNRLIEQAEQGTESNAVTSMLAYKPVIEWWTKKSKSSSSAKKSLEYWQGDVAKDKTGITVNSTNTLLKHLQTLSKNNVYNLDTTKLTELIKYLQTNIAANVYFAPRTLNQPETRVIQLLATLKPDGDPTKTSLANEKSAIDSFNRADLNKIKASLEKTQFVYTSITEQDKIALLKYFEDKANARAASHNKLNANNPLGKFVQWDMEKAIKEASSIQIGPDAGTITRDDATETEPSIINVYTMSYPDNSKPSPELQNFFLGDDVVAVSAENEAKFKEILQNLLSQIPQGEKIIEVTTYAESATSKVPTTYKNNGQYSTTANETLVNDRLAQIQEALGRVVTNTIPKGEWKIVTESKAKPNIGPEWGDEERKAYPLAKRRVKNTDGTPNPQYDKNIVAAYEAKYGAYKGSLGQISIKTEGRTEIPNKTEPSIEAAGKWFAKITWPAGNIGNPKELRGKNKGEKLWTGQGTTGCPFW